MVWSSSFSRRVICMYDYSGWANVMVSRSYKMVECVPLWEDRDCDSIPYGNTYSYIYEKIEKINGTLLVERYVPYGNVPLWDASIRRSYIWEYTINSRMVFVGLAVFRKQSPLVALGSLPLLSEISDKKKSLPRRSVPFPAPTSLCLTQPLITHMSCHCIELLSTPFTSGTTYCITMCYLCLLS